MSKEKSWKFSEAANLIHDSTVQIAWLLSLQVMIAKFPVIAFWNLNLGEACFLLSLAFVDSLYAQQGLMEMCCSQKALFSWVLHS